MPKRILSILIFFVIVSSIPPFQGVSADDSRRQTGDGGTLPFSTGQRVLGAYLQLVDGREAFQCVTVAAPMGGNVTSGVINPFNEETQGMRTCSFTFPPRNITVANVLLMLIPTTTVTPTPIPTTTPIPVPPSRRQSGAGNWMKVFRGEAVAGGIVHPRQYLADTVCFIQSIPFDGWVFEGVANPYPLEIQGMRVCDNLFLGVDPPNDGPWIRRQSGQGNWVGFNILEPVGAGIVRYIDGRQDTICFLPSPSQVGAGFEGVVWPMTAEARNLRRCNLN